MRPHGMQLFPEPDSRTGEQGSPLSVGKLETSSALDRPLEVKESEVHHPNTYMYASPVDSTGGYHVVGSVDGVQVSLLLDTGAAVTLLREDTWSQVTTKNPQALRPWSALELVSAGGTTLTARGCASVELELGGEKFMVEIVVVSSLTSEAILGLDSLREQEASIDLASRRLHLKGKRCNIPLNDPTTAHEHAFEHTVRAARTVEVPPRSMLEVLGNVEDTVVGTCLLEQATDKCLPFALARALVQPTSTTIPVCVLNSFEDPVTVYAGMLLATLQGVKPTRGVEAITGDGSAAATESDKQEMLGCHAEKVGSDLSAGERDVFYHLLLSYADVFACSTSDLGRTNKLRHYIHTGDATPSVSQFMSHPIVVKKVLDQMLEKGVVEPSTSPWASLVVLVQKKDGSTRFCVDYRKVNDVTRKDAYPLPRIDTTLDTLHGSQWFTTLDLVSGYWQVEVNEADREKENRFLYS